MEVVILRYLELVWIGLKIEEEERERKGKKGKCETGRSTSEAD